MRGDGAASPKANSDLTHALWFCLCQTMMSSQDPPFQLHLKILADLRSRADPSFHDVKHTRRAPSVNSMISSIASLACRAEARSVARLRPKGFRRGSLLSL